MEIYFKKISQELVRLKKLGYTAEKAKKKIKDRFLKVKPREQTENFRKVRDFVIANF